MRQAARQRVHQRALTAAGRPHHAVQLRVAEARRHALQRRVAGLQQHAQVGHLQGAGWYAGGLETVKAQLAEVMDRLIGWEKRTSGVVIQAALCGEPETLALQQRGKGGCCMPVQVV